MNIAVIGGGITGLSAAWELQKRGIEFTLLEASDCWGGKVNSPYLKPQIAGVAKLFHPIWS